MGLNSEGLLSVIEAAAYLGISRFTIYCWTSQKRIPYVKIGGRTMLLKEDLDRFISKNRVEPKAA
jgi:excisionase family DNA binding protein